MTLDELLAREAIRDIVTRYNSYGDSGRFEPLWELFTADASMEIRDADGTRRYDGLAGIRQIFIGAQERVRTEDAATPPAYLRHFTATHQIDLVDADRAAGRCYFAVIMDGGLDHWGRYLDEYARVGSQWRFAHRTVIVDGRSETSWFAAPPDEG